MGRVGAIATEALDTAKIGLEVAGNTLKEGVAATTEALTGVAQKGESLLTGLAEGATTAERVTIAGLSESLPVKVFEDVGEGLAKGGKLEFATTAESKSLAGEVLREGESAGSSAAKTALQGDFISLSGYDASLGNLEKLEEAANMFKDNPSAIAKDGPLAKLLQNGKAGSSAGNLSTGRGAAYELEKAYDLTRAGEEVLVFGNKSALVHPDTGKVIKILDVDIETATKIIECKSIDWTKTTSKGIETIKSKLPELRKLALAKGKSFELHSRFKLPSELKKWLIDQKITFIVG